MIAEAHPVSSPLWRLALVAALSFGSGCSGDEEPAPALAPPGTPTNVRAVAGDDGALVSWDAPSVEGSSPITHYMVASFPGEVRLRVEGGDATQAHVEGLESGVSYTFTVAAANVVGEGLPSRPSAPVTPSVLPPPAEVKATAGDGAASVSWRPRPYNGSSPITGYTVTSEPGGFTMSVDGDVWTADFEGLTNGTSYVFTVTAHSAERSSLPSLASPPVIPFGLPAPPVEVQAQPGDARAAISWIAPANDGGAPITGYTVTAAPGGATQEVGGDDTTAVVEGLINGTVYTFTVTATNAVGTSVPSAPSAPVTPVAPPGPPTEVVAVAGAASALVSWVAPGQDGGSPVVGYTVTASPGGATQNVDGDETSALVAGLVNGTLYAFTVTATNAIGTSAPSAPSAPARPVDVPGAPTSVEASVAGRQAIVSWSAPESTGGKPVTAYRVIASPGDLSQSFDGETHQALFDGLDYDTAYTFTVAAANELGFGPDAVSSPVTPLRTPSFEGSGLIAGPTPLLADGEEALTLTLIAVDAEGAPISNATVSLSSSVDADVFSQTSGVTDADGRMTVQVTSLEPGARTFTATIDWNGGLVLEATALFLDPTLLCAAGDLSLSRPVSVLKTGDTPSVVKAADINGDGTLDLIVANREEAYFNVFLGAGGAYFDAGPSPSSSTGSRDMALADFDGDGHLDIVSSSAALNNVRVFLGDGAGGFSLAGLKDTLGAPGAVLAADLNGDDHVDVAVASGEGLHVFFGTGDGTLDDGDFYPHETAPTAVRAADLDGDGHIDLVVTRSSSNVSKNKLAVYAGIGEGAFEEVAEFDSGDDPQALVLEDLDGDGHLDAVVANSRDDTVSVFPGVADGFFAAKTDHATGSKPGSIEVVDLNGDGSLDLVVSHNTGTPLSSFSVLLGDGAGSFAERTHRTVSLPGVIPSAIPSIAAADFNGDGVPDLAVLLSGSRDLALLQGAGDGSFAWLQEFVVRANPAQLVLTDLDADGFSDLVVTSRSGHVSVLRGNGVSFDARQDYRVGANPQATAVHDLNGDGLLDLIVANHDSNSLSILLGEGDGAFGARRDLPAGVGPNAVAVADFDADGIADIAVTSVGSHTLSVFLGDINSSFTRRLVFETGPRPGSVAVADFNADGLPDLVVSGTGSASIGVFLGTADGSFAKRVDYEALDNPDNTTVADFNRDGVPDVAVLNANAISVFLGKGNGSFSERVDVAIDPLASAMASADFNADGIPDLVVTHQMRLGTMPLSGTASLMLGAGDGTFVEAVSYPLQVGFGSIVAGDLSGDGRPDVAAANPMTGTVSVLSGLCE